MEVFPARGSPTEKTGRYYGSGRYWLCKWCLIYSCKGQCGRQVGMFSRTRTNTRSHDSKASFAHSVLLQRDSPVRKSVVFPPWCRRDAPLLRRPSISRLALQVQNCVVFLSATFFNYYYKLFCIIKTILKHVSRVTSSRCFCVKPSKAAEAPAGVATNTTTGSLFTLALENLIRIKALH